MANKLVYTSAPKGLIPGSCGFCTVAGTRGMTKTVVDALEGLAGYRRVYETTDALHRNPVAFSHLMVATPRGRLRVLARIAEARPDYSGRTNHIASFLQLEEAETPKRGPAYLFSQPGLFETQWPNAQPPIAYPSPVAIPMEEDTYPRPCDYWRVVADDPGWAGVLASTIETRRLAILVVRPTIDVLKLFQEAIALLPANQRWNATFATYYTNTLKNVDCLWRGVVVGSPEEAQARATSGALILDFTALPAIESFKTNPTIWRWVEIARQPVDRLALYFNQPAAAPSNSQTPPTSRRFVHVPPSSAKTTLAAVPPPTPGSATPPPARRTNVHVPRRRRRPDIWIARHRKLLTLLCWIGTLPWIYLTCFELGIIDAIPWRAKDEPVATVPVDEETQTPEDPPFDRDAYVQSVENSLQKPRELLKKYQESLAPLVSKKYDNLMIRIQILDEARGALGDRYSPLKSDYNGSFKTPYLKMKEEAENVEKAKKTLTENKKKLAERIQQVDTLLDDFNSVDLQVIDRTELDKKIQEINDAKVVANEIFADPDKLTSNGRLLSDLEGKIEGAAYSLTKNPVVVIGFERLTFEIPARVGMNSYCKSLDTLVGDIEATAPSSIDGEQFRTDLLEQIKKTVSDKSFMDKRVYALYSSKEELKNGFFIFLIDSEKYSTMLRLNGKIMKFACRFDGGVVDVTSPFVEKIEEYDEEYDLFGGDMLENVYVLVYETLVTGGKLHCDGVFKTHLPDEAISALVGE